MSILGEVQQFGLDTVIELFVLDATTKTGETYYFHAGTNEMKGDVVWQGQTYTAIPVQCDGFETSGTQYARPKLSVANVQGAFSNLIRAFGGLEGCKVIRKRTLARYLDAVNFISGNPTANPGEYFQDDVFYITRKLSENKVVITWELGSALDLQGVFLPRRQVIANVCPFVYRGEECGYAGPAVARADDSITTDINEDKCSHKVSGCKLRFGDNGDLRFGGFPGSSLVGG